MSLFIPPASVATLVAAIRADQSVELGRIDAAISTRLATAGYTAPDNAGIAALPTLAEIVAANIPVNVKEVNDVVVTGSGTELDPWGAA